LLEQALQLGGDTATASAGLAVLAARAGRWAEAAARARAALRVARGTYRHPFPADPLRETLTPLALDGPPALADSILVAALAARPGWATLYELRGLVALRAGRCNDAADAFIGLADFSIERADAPDAIARCRRGESR
jgi:hypothetical protein